MRRFSTLLAGLVLVVGLMAGATSPASAEIRQFGTWVGAVERHGDHFDYVGRPCPVEVDFCIAAVYRYRIVPASGQALLALPGVAGGTASLEGFLIPFGDGQHQGVLVVRRVTPAPVSPPAAPA